MKILLLLGFCVLSLLPAKAQPLHVGLEVGAISSHAEYTLFHRRNTHFSAFNLGFNIHDRERIYINTGLMYLRQGARFEADYWYFEEPESNMALSMRDFVALPISLDFYFGKSKQVFASFGFYWAFNVHNELILPGEIAWGLSISSNSSLENNKGGMLRLGYRVYQFKNLDVNVVGRFMQSFDSRDYCPSCKPRFTFNSFALTVGVNYTLIK